MISTSWKKQPKRRPVAEPLKILEQKASEQVSDRPEDSGFRKKSIWSQTSSSAARPPDRVHEIALASPLFEFSPKHSSLPFEGYSYCHREPLTFFSFFFFFFFIMSKHRGPGSQRWKPTEHKCFLKSLWINIEVLYFITSTQNWQ